MPDWTWAAASRRGTAHEANGEGRQDAYRVLAVGRFVIAIACDGAGSTRHGRLGAVIAARMLSMRAAEWVDRHEAAPPPGTVEMWVAEARLAILVHADRRGCVMGEFASTLAMVISDGTSTISAHVGDGAIIGRRASSDSFTDLSWPESGQYASTTFFLTDEAPRLRIGVMSGIAIDCLAIMTDGLERLALNFADRVVHPAFFRGIFAPFASIASCGRDRKLSKQLAVFLSSDTVNARTDDDKTLVLATLR